MAITRPELGVEFSQRYLDRLQVGLGWQLDIDHHGLDLDRIAVRITGYVWSERLGTHTVRYPRDWWEALKERFAPCWFTLRYPVVYANIVLEAKALYPDFQCPVPSGNYRMRLEVVSGDT